ncbi:MAG: hypothetical protein AAFV53_30870 [Myxococcota bacterium]
MISSLLLHSLLFLPQAQADDVDVHLAQAKLYIKRKYYQDAAGELRKAIAAGGDTRFDVCMTATGVAWEILDVEWATTMALAAADAAPSPEQAAAARQLAEGYTETFGFLTVDAPYPGMTTRIQLEAQGLLFDPELKRYVNAIALKWRDRHALPERVALPAGVYLVNGQSVTVTAAAEQSLRLPMSAVGTRGLNALQVTRLEGSLGIRAWNGLDVDNILPSFHAQVTLTQPIGPILLGAAAGTSSFSYVGENNRLIQGQLAPTGVGRVGKEFVLSGAFSVRPTLQFGVGWFPGIGLRCDGTSCSPASGDAIDRYVNSVAYLGGGELLIEYREAGRTTAVGTGVKLVAEQAFGRLPASRDDWTAIERNWSATGFQMLANLSFAL